MRILVVGSNHYSDSESSWEEVKRAGCDLGRALAKTKHTVVLGSESENTVDKHVFDGLRLASGKNKILVSRPDSEGTPFHDYRGEMNISYERSKGRWGSSRVQQVLASDVVILLGGGRGTRECAYIAPALERPVLALPIAGASKELWEHFLRDYERIPNASPYVSTIGERWSSESSNASLNLLKLLYERNPYRDSAIWPHLALFFATLLLFVVWTYLFFKPFDSSLLTCFVLLAVSSMFGTVLRTMLSSISPPPEPIDWSAFPLSAAVGLIISFALALLYLVGGLAITWEREFLNVEGTDFQRVAIMLSILGIGGALLIERSSARLRKVLGGLISSGE